jgi:hypothetical protein
VNNGSTNPPPTALSTWEVTAHGKNPAIAYLSLNQDFSLTGYGIQSDCSGVFSFTGTWAPSNTSAIAGSVIETSGCGAPVAGISATMRAGHWLKVTETTTSGIRKWKGIPVSTGPDLSGSWLGETQDRNQHVTTVQSYNFSPHNGSPGAFDIVDGTTEALVGSAIVTSHNRISAHVIVDGRDSSLTGKLNSKKHLITLDGLDVTGQKIIIRITQQP